MYDELVKALHDGAEFLECSTPGIKNSFAKMCHNAADAIEELSKPRWIPVTERLPEGRVEVLVSSGVFAPFIEVAFYDGLFYSAWDGETEIVAVTHWMPLPQPPKEE